MRFLPLGSTEEIGASALYLNIDGTGILLDAGQDPNIDGEEGLPRLGLLERADRPLDHVVVTHAHHDHVGALPVVLREFPHAAVHMTRPTRLLLDVVLPASARLQRRRITEGVMHGSPTFSEEQAQALSFVYEGHELETPFAMTGIRGGPVVHGTLYHSGHILGGAGLLLEFERNGGTARVFYTSDTSLRSQVLLPGARYPEPPLDVLILESTLGADAQAEYVLRKDQEKALGDSIERVLARGGTVLIPVFALGRAQEVLALIDRYKRRGTIPDEIPVYTSGSMRVVSDIYDRTRYTSPRLDPEFEVFGVPQKRLPRQAARENEALGEPSIHIAASGMMFERTLSNRIARHLLPGERHAIFFVGFVKEDTPGHRLLEASRDGAESTVTLDKLHEAQTIRCEVDSFRLSGHSHRRDLIQIVERTRPRNVVLVHGENEAREWMADNIRYFYPDVEVVLPRSGEEISL